MTEKSSAVFKTARELYEIECSTSSPVTSGCKALDSILGRGFFPGCVMEISGEAGCGKSQICMQLAATTIANGQNVICIETERGISVSRICQMLEYRTEQLEHALQRLLISSPSTLEQFMNVLGRLEESSKQLEETSVVIVDAVATFFRGCSAKEDYQKWRNVLSILSSIALRHNIVVVYVNHVTSRQDSYSGKWITVPYLSKGLFKRPTIQLWLERTTSGTGTRRTITVLKSPFSPKYTAECVITNSGIALTNDPSIR